MDVKKYRATTTREALELIKQDLGEDAFVLETKQIKTGGFLGLRSQTQIEVSAASPKLFEQPQKKKQKVNKQSSDRILSLKDETIAEPKPFEPKNIARKNKTLDALSVRASSKDTDFIPKVSRTFKRNFRKDKKKIEPVEISSKAPKLVHPKRKIKTKKPILSKKQDSAKVLDKNSVNAMASGVSKRELEMLHAELREVKFSIGAFASQVSHKDTFKDIDLNEYGEIYDSPFYDTYIELTSTGFSPNLIRSSLVEIIPIYREGLIKLEDLRQTVLQNALDSILKFENDPLQNEDSSILAVVGATGVGKTTTIAKLAARVALHERRHVELVTLDTYRIAAVEQLKTYAEIIGVGCRVVNSVLELDAVLTRLPEDTTVLIDTTGKNPYDLADQLEISDYLTRNDKIRKCLAVQANMNPADSKAAMKKFEMYGADCLALTKIDETLNPGQLIETIAQNSLPLTYLCMGQRVPEDISVASPENLAKLLLPQNSISTAYAA